LERAIFDGPDNIIHFLIGDDDGSHPSGFLDYVRIYDTALDSDQVAELYRREVSPPPPECPPLKLEFSVYDVKAKAFDGGSGRRGDELNLVVDFEDPYREYEKKIKKAKHILVPLGANGAEVLLDGNGGEPAQALVCYDFKKIWLKPKKECREEDIGEDVRVFNDLYNLGGWEGQDVEITKLRRICVPSEITPSQIE